MDEGAGRARKRWEQRERERKREGKEGREKNKGVFTCLWNQQLAALSHNLRHMDVIRTTVSVCECVSDYICVRERESTGVSVSLSMCLCAAGYRRQSRFCGAAK